MVSSTEMKEQACITAILLFLSACAGVPASESPSTSPVKRIQSESQRETLTKEDIGNALLEAVKVGDYDKAQELLAAGADANSKDEKHFMPLEFAVRNADKKMVELLLANGANADIQYRHATNPLCRAVRDGNMEIVKLLVENGASVTYSNLASDPLQLAIGWGGDQEIAKYLISKGADIDDSFTTITFSSDKFVIEHMAPLHLAAKCSWKEIVELLVVNGCRINVKDSRGRTPVDYAYRWEIEKFLRKHGGKSSWELNKDK